MQEDFRYLATSRKDRRWGIYVTGAGIVLDGEPTAKSIHPQPYFCQWDQGRVLPDYAAIYHPTSSLEIESENTSPMVVPPGNFVFLCRGVWHRYRPVREPQWTEYWVCFNGWYVDSLVREHFFSPQEPFHHIGSDARLIGPYRRLMDRVRSSAQPGLAQLLAATVTEILGTALALSRISCADEESSRMVQQAKRVLDDHPEQQIDVRQLAVTLGVSYRHFRTVFKEMTGFAPYQYHLQVRIGRARQLLSETDLTLADIAKRLKFNDSYHLSKTFKRHIGISPSAWRHQVSVAAR